jgi:predicted acetyltransferase
MIRLAFLISREEGRFYESLDPITLEQSRGLFDDDGNMLCAMWIVDGGALYFGTERSIPTALITAVAAPPEYRRKGYVRELFAGMFEEERAKGTALTALYPFYFPFYRSFGYELAHDAARHTVKIDQFKPWRDAAARGRFVQIDTERLKREVLEGSVAGEKSDLAVMQAIYDRWATRNLGAVERSGKWWLHKMTHKAEFVQVYIYYDERGEAKAYIIYRLEDKGDWVRDVVVHEVMGADRQGTEALYGFLYNHDSQAEKVKLWTPVDAGLPNLLPDPREDEMRVHAGYMLRLLDVEGAFRQRLFRPEARGEFTFEVRDEMLPANTGAYHVSVRDGKAETRRIGHEGGGRAGLKMSERVLAQLYGGYMSPVRAAQLGLLEVMKEWDLMGMQGALHPPGQPVPYMADDF